MRSGACAASERPGCRWASPETSPRGLERWARDADFPADVVSSSDSLGARKPDLRFFELVAELAGCPASEVAYVGDRVDNDVLPAAAAGLVAVHVRRGPWGSLQASPPEAALVVDDLASLPQALASLP